MANVLFKRGLQSALPAQGSAQDGVFYLTQDTNRLYIGEGTNLKLLNQTVQIVANAQELSTISSNWTTTAQKQAHKNDFYYIPVEGGGENTHNGNILAVWTGTNWQQINPDTNTYLSELSAAASSTNNVATVTINGTNSGDESVLPASFTITAGTGLTTTASGSNITLNGETYSLAKSYSSNNSGIASINLNNSTTTNSAVKLHSGNNVSIAEASDGFTINAVDSVISSATATFSNGTFAITVFDNNEHQAAATATNVGIAVNNGYVPITSVTAGSTAKSVYTTEEVDSLLAGLDGMTFKGTYNPVGGTVTTLPTTGVHVGDTYVITAEGLTSVSNGDPDTTSEISSGVYGGIPGGTRVGDLLIAKGTETNGVITSGLVWTYIPAGNDSSLAYTYSAVVTTATNTLELQNGIPETIAKIGLTAGDGISITSTAEGTTTLLPTISHGTYSTTSTTADASSKASYTAITGLTITNGHVTGIAKETFTPPVYALSGSTASSTTANAAKFTVSLDAPLDDFNYGTADINLTSSSLNFSVPQSTTGTVAIDLVWGTF